jgi:hypothetical protein
MREAMTAHSIPTGTRIRRLLLGGLLLGGIGFFLATGQAQHRPADTARPKGTDPAAAPAGRIPRRAVTFTAEREAAALTFVRQNRPEVLEVLEDLKTRQRPDYERAICDFFWTSETLAGLDKNRRTYALKTWQLETLCHLLAAQLAAQPAEAERLRADLEQTVQQLVEAQIEESAYEIRQQEAQLKRAQGAQKRMESRRDELVRERLAAILKAVEQPAKPPRGSNP